MSPEFQIGWIPTSRDLKVASARLRCAIPVRYLREVGWNCEFFSPADMNNYDVVVFQKVYDEQALELARSLRTKGKKIVFDLCDNHFYNPDNLPHLEDRAAQLRKMIELADAVVVSTPLLAALVDRESFVVDDALDDLNVQNPSLLERIRSRLRSKGRLRIVWYGNAGLASPSFGLSHIQSAIPLLEELNAEIGLSLTVISNSRSMFGSVLASTSFETRYVPWRLSSFPRIFPQHDFCVIPIEINPFTVCKTSNRVALSLLMKVPVIADPIPSFREFEQFILLNDWWNSLKTYASDYALRQTHADRGEEYVRRTFTKERVISQWGNVLSRLGSEGESASSTPHQTKSLRSPPAIEDEDPKSHG